jgi:anthranilate phosphoribosyltransferase
MVRGVLAGEESPATEMVIANAAAALYVAGVSRDLREGAERARAAIRSGRARRVLEELVEFTNRADQRGAGAAHACAGEAK